MQSSHWNYFISLDQVLDKIPSLTISDFLDKNSKARVHLGHVSNLSKG